ARSEAVNESPDRALRPRRPPRKARRRVIAGGYGEEEQRRAAGCIGRRATGGNSFTASHAWPSSAANTSRSGPNSRAPSKRGRRTVLTGNSHRPASRRVAKRLAPYAPFRRRVRTGWRLES